MATDASQDLTGDRLYETIAEVSAQLSNRSLTDLPPDVRRTIDGVLLQRIPLYRGQLRA